MSIINTMLQDLDKRNGRQAGEAKPGDAIRSVNVQSPWHLGRNTLLLLVGLSLVILAAGFWLRSRNNAAPPVPALANRVAPAPAPAPIAAVPAPAPASNVPPAAATTTVATATVATTSATSPAPSPEAAQKPVPAPPQITAPAPKLAEAHAVPAVAPAVASVVTAAASAPAKTDAAPTKTALASPAPAAPTPATPPAAPSPVLTAAAPAAHHAAARPAGATPAVAAGKTYSPGQLSANLIGEATRLDRQGRQDEAKLPLQKALEADPLDAQARSMLVQLHLDTGQIEHARALLAEGRRLQPEQASFSLTLARLMVDGGDVPGAIRLLEADAAKARDEPQVHAFLAAMLLRVQRYDDAVKHYLVALRYDPANASWLVGVGVALEAIGKPADAAEAYRRAGDAPNLRPETSAFLSERLARLGR